MIAAAMTVMFAAAIHAQRKECAVCGMWMDQYMHTRFVIHLKDKTTHEFCGISCAHKYIRENASKVKKIMAADYQNAKLINAESAFYVEASDAPPVMSAVSWVAFSSESRAMEFIKSHGGKLRTFKEAMAAFDSLRN